MFSKYYKKLDNIRVMCTLCNRFCILKNNEFGFCNVRQNIDNKIFSHVYNKPISINIDPIEKKPLYFFLKNTNTLSFGTPGCNFDCAFCQNHEVSYCKGYDFSKLQEYNAKEIVNLALKNKCKSISYTYTEPTIFGEYALEAMREARANNLKNVFVSNGYFSKEYLSDILPYLDAINIDLKGTQRFYDKLIPGVKLDLIKENIKTIHKNKIHLELTTLIIEGYNSSREDLEELFQFIHSLSPNICLHLSRALPHYRLKDIIPTPLKTLVFAKKLAEDIGLKHVYLGNV